VKAVVFVICLVLSLPNLLLGLALATVQRTFANRNVLDMIDHLLESVLWGIPIAAGVVLVLLVAGFITGSRRYAAVCALLLNVVALSVVVFRMTPPDAASQLVVFLPVLLALAGFTWIAFAPSRAASHA